MARARTRLAVLAFGATAGLLGAWLAACGLPQGGLGATIEAGAGGGGGNDATASTEGSSAGGDDEGGGQGCSSVDAACLGPLPSGWQPIGLTDGGCGPGFTGATLVTNPRIEDGGCACGACQVVGAFACNAAVSISGGDNCTDPTLVDASPGVCTQAQAQHVEVHPVAATGTVACSAPNDAGFGAAFDELKVCVPGCAADYCSGASRCIAAEDQVPCPTGFTLFAYAGTSADPGCAPCACEAGAPGLCDGSVTVFLDDQCSADASPTVYSVGSCNTNSVDYNSLRVDLVPPTPTCSVPGGGSLGGDASLEQVRTICCQ